MNATAIPVLALVLAGVPLAGSGPPSAPASGDGRAPAARAEGDPAVLGLAALREGRAPEARELLEQAVRMERERGRTPGSALLFDLGLAALRAGRPEEARAAFLEARAGARPGDPARSPAGLGLGAALWRLSEAAEGSGPAGLEKALGLAREAREAWIRTLVEQEDLDPVRRNIVRANRRIAELEERLAREESRRQEQPDSKDDKDDKDDKQRKENDRPDQGQQPERQNQEDQKDARDRNEQGSERKQDEGQPEQGRQGRGEEQPPEERPERSGRQEAETRPAGKEQELSPEELRQLLERLEKMEARRLELERRRAPARPAHGRDW